MAVIDIHSYLGAPPESVRTGTLKELSGIWRLAKINGALVASGRGASGDFRRGNEAVQREIDGRANVWGLCTVNPNYPGESADELRARLSGTLFRGLKVPRATAGPRIDSPGMRAILSAARRYGRPVLLETTCETDVRDAVSLAAEFHALRFILLGMGGPDWPSSIGIAEPQLNISLEIGSLEADADKVKDALDAVGPRRIMFGSHFPLLHPLYVLGMVEDSAIEPRDQERLLARNAVEAFELEPIAALPGTREGDGSASE
ncbi:MAG TPA: hypothetical protein DCZ72_05570 [Armatimonadetes bacterium]|nr:hypothetical protein [Armatimonadota bacterium]